jgi:hypothetical protein
MSLVTDMSFELQSAFSLHVDSGALSMELDLDLERVECGDLDLEDVGEEYDDVEQDGDGEGFGVILGDGSHGFVFILLRVFGMVLLSLLVQRSSSLSLL